MKLLTRVLFLCISFVVCRQIVKAQEDTSFVLYPYDELLNRFEELIDENESNQEELMDLLVEEQEQRKISGKINLNALSAEIAFEYLHLSDYQYYNLLAYLSEYGEMVSVWELNAVEGFSFEEVRRLQVLITVESVGREHRFFKDFFKKSKSSFLLRYGQVLEKQAGYDQLSEKHYLGSPMRLAFKYQFSTQDKLSIAISGEKDAGEQFFKGAQKYGFDFYSAYLCLKNIGVLKKMVIGDFRLDLGQGLVMGSTLMSGKGGGIGNVRHFAGMIKPVAPFNESTALRGVSATVGNYHYTGTMFAAYRQYDGNVNVDEDSNRVFEGSLSSSGYHRTEAELDKSNNLRAWVMGGDFLYRSRIFRIGARVVYTLFDAEVLPTGRVYQQYAFSGKGIFNAGVDYQLIIKRLVLFGEAAVSGNSGWAFRQGAVFELSPGASFALVGHYYDKNYIALHGFASGSSQGEWGLYLTTRIILNPRMDLDFFYDYNKFTWLRYRLDAPGESMVTGLNLAVSLGRKAKLLLRYQYKMKQKNRQDDVRVNAINPFYTSKLRLIWECRPLDFLKLKTEADYIINHSKLLAYKQDGLLLYQDAGIEVGHTGVGFNIRIAFFDTDTYEERLYAYENDLYYSFTINSYYDKGWRAYLMVRYAYKCFHVWLRLSQTWFLNKEEIGSGMDLIQKKHKTELKAQVMLKW